MAFVGHVFVKRGLFANPSRLESVWGCVRCMSSAVSSRQDSLLHQRQQNAFYQARYMSKQKGFFGELIENIQSEMKKNKEMKDNLKKFREEADKLEQSDALKKARQKFENIQAETSGTGDDIKKKLSEFQEKIKESVEESGVGKKGEEIAEKVSKTVGKTAETISKQGEQIAQTKVFKSVAEGMEAVKEEAISRSRLYKPPAKLRMRDEGGAHAEQREVEANEEATGITLHKDSRFYQSWQNFKDNNQIINKMFDIKSKYDESDNVMVRATRSVTEKVSELFGSMFSQTEMSEVLTEIVKMDPDFDREQFVKQVQYDIIPNVLEAMMRPELEVLEDWCHEAAYNMLAQPIKQAQKAGYLIQNRVLDVSHVDLAAGKMMEQGPVLVVSFTAQQIMCVRNTSGAIVEGDPEKILKVFHVWAFCRDQTILDPKSAWRVIDLSSSPSEQWL